MIMKTSITRRFILRMIAAGAGTIGLMGFRPALSVTQDSAAKARKLTSIINDYDSARDLGIEYLRIIPDEANINTLVNLLSSTHHLIPLDIEMTKPIDLRNAISRQLQFDFKSNEVINLHGWILSRTEVRLCALSALMA